MDDGRWSQRSQNLAFAVRGLAIVAAILSVGLLVLAAGFDRFGYVTGGLGVLGAVFLWLEVKDG